MLTRSTSNAPMVLRDDLLAAETLPACCLVRLDGDGFSLCDANDSDCYGATIYDGGHAGLSPDPRLAATVTSGSAPMVWPLTCGGVVTLRSAGAVANRAIVFQAASGRVSGSGSVRRGVALAEATGSNQLIDVALLP